MNAGKWSEISVVMIPFLVMKSLFIDFVNILSIKVAVFNVTRVGCVSCGK